MRSIALLLLVLVACQEGTLIEVTVTGRDASAVSLELRVLSDQLSAPTEQREAQSRVDLRLRRPLRGSVRVEVAALDASDCAVQEGQGEVVVGDLDVYQLVIALPPAGSPDCRLQINRVGPGFGEVLVYTPEQQQPLLTCADLTSPCTFKPQRSRQELRLVARPAAGSVFTGWTSDVSGCAGLDCSFELGRAGARVSVALQPQTNCGEDQFCWDSPKPSGDTLSAVWARSPRDVYAVGAAGSVLHYNGQTWYALGSGVRTALADLFATPQGPLWAVGAHGALLRIAGDVVTQVPLPLANDADLRSVWDGGGELWVVGCAQDGTGLVLRRKADRWQRLEAAEALPCLNRVRGRTSGPNAEVWMVGDQGVVVNSRGDALQRQTVGNQSLHGLYLGAQEGFAVGEGATLLGYDGVSWTPRALRLNTAARPALYDIWGSAAGELWVVGSSQTLLRYDGSTWSQMLFGDNGTYLLGAHGSGASDVWFVGSTGITLRWDGLRLRGDGTGNTPTLWRVSALGQDQALAVGELGTALRWNGVLWQPATAYTGQKLVDMTRTATGAIYALGHGGDILHWTGQLWEAHGVLDFVADPVFTGIWARGDDELLISTTIPNSIYRYVPSTHLSFVETITLPNLTIDLDGIAGQGSEVWVIGRVRDDQSAVRVPLVMQLDAPILTPRAAWALRDGFPLKIWLGASGPWLAGSDFDVKAGRIWRWTGSGFVSEATPGEQISALAGSGAEPTWAVGTGGTLLRRDNGAWKQIYSSSSSALYDVTVLPNGSVITVGLGGQILRRPPPP